MKKLFFLILFFSINVLTFGANVYFLNGGSGYVYTNGQTFNSNQNGYASVSYWIWADPTKYNYGHCGAKFQSPDGNWSDWSDLGSGSQGTHHCLKAGTWHVKGRVWVYRDIYGYKNYWMETDFTLCFYVVDNYAPAAPQNFQLAFQMNQHPVLTWDANTEDDLSGYRIYKKYTSTCCGVWTTSVFTTSNSYTDNYFTANYKFGEDQVEYWIVAEDINENVSGESQHHSGNGYGPAWKQAYNNNNEEIPSENKLSQNFPNPFNPSTEITYNILEDDFVNITVYNTIGQEVAVLVNQYQAAGRHAIKFKAENLPSGIYIYKLQSGRFSDVKKMLLTK